MGMTMFIEPEPPPTFVELLISGFADSDEENRSFRADDDQIIAERRCREYCGAGDRHGSRKTFGMQSTSFRFWICRGRCLRKLCLCTPLALHLPHSRRQIPQ